MLCCVVMVFLVATANQSPFVGEKEFNGKLRGSDECVHHIQFVSRLSIYTQSIYYYKNGDNSLSQCLSISLSLSAFALNPMETDRTAIHLHSLETCFVLRGEEMDKKKNAFLPEIAREAPFALYRL